VVGVNVRVVELYEPTEVRGEIFDPTMVFDGYDNQM
jgi:hypothetical protein